VTSSPVTGGTSHRFLGTLVLLTVRGLLLWVIVPLGLLLWPFVAARLRKRGVGLGQFLGWVDLNLISAIQRSLARSLFDTPIPWLPLSAASDVSHRIHKLDAF
jgi:hypothetical protein